MSNTTFINCIVSDCFGSKFPCLALRSNLSDRTPQPFLTLNVSRDLFNKHNFDYRINEKGVLCYTDLEDTKNIAKEKFAYEFKIDGLSYYHICDFFFVNLYIDYEFI